MRFETTEQYRIKTELKLTRLQRTKNKKRHKTDENWVRNISSRPLDKTETQVLSYGLKHSVTPKRIPTETIVSSVEAVLSRQRDLSEPTKDNISQCRTIVLYLMIIVHVTTDVYSNISRKQRCWNIFKFK